ncbi:MAG: hypothetical protein AB7J13_13775 [Pyrinomonadaceae bacterium]
MRLTFFELRRSVGINNGTLAFDRLRTLPVKISASIRLREISRQLETHMGDFFAEHDKLIMRHGVEKDGTWVVERAGENLPFQADVQRLLAQVIEVKGDRMTLADLFTANGLEDAKFAAQDLEALDWLIDDGVTERVDPEPPAEEEVDSVNEPADAAADSESNVLDLPARSATA